jgi:hypothetical protein
VNSQVWLCFYTQIIAVFYIISLKRPFLIEIPSNVGDNHSGGRKRKKIGQISSAQGS